MNNIKLDEVWILKITKNLLKKCEKWVTSKLAVQLERTLGISANIWNNLNADYSLFYARLKEAKELKQKQEWITHFSIRELKKFGFLLSVKDIETIMEKLLQFWFKFFHEAAHILFHGERIYLLMISKGFSQKKKMRQIVFQEIY